MEEVNLSINDYKKIKSIIKKDTKDKVYKLDIENKDYDYKSKEFWMVHIVNALNIKELDKRYEYIYDTMCTFLDVISHKLCDFNCNKCYGNRTGKSVFDIDGCCYFHGKQCPYLVDKVCQKRSISCKIFICLPLEKKYKFKSKVNTYPLLNYFFNNKQKDIIHYSYRQTKEEVIPNLLKLVK